MTRTDLIDDLNRLTRYFRQRAMHVAANVCERAAETITTDSRAVEAWEAVKRHQFRVVPLRTGREWYVRDKYDFQTGDGTYADPITAVLTAAASEKARQE